MSPSNNCCRIGELEFQHFLQTANLFTRTPQAFNVFSLLRHSKKKLAFALFSDIFVESGYALVVGGGWF